MILHIFECEKYQRQQKHVTSTPTTPLGLSYLSECATCDKMRAFQFVREGNRKEDWYSNILRQVQRKQSAVQLNKSRRKDDDIGDDQAERVAI